MNLYRINYDLAGGNEEIANPTVGNKLYPIPLNNPTKKDYTFSGWTLGGSSYNFNSIIYIPTTHNINNKNEDNFI